MTVDITPVVNVLMGLASVAITTAIPILVPFVLKRLHVANDSDMAQRIETAADAAAGMAYHYALQHEEGLASVPVHDAALAGAIEHVVKSVPDALAKLGITQDHVRDMVTARLGVLLASASVQAGRPPAVPPIAEPAVVPTSPVAATAVV